jgi:hypothetical protein
VRVLRWVGHAGVFAVLTVVSQLGGIAWLLALRFQRRVLAFLLIYAAFWGVAQGAAPLFGRVPLPCFGEVMRAQSPLYCVLLRNFATPELAEVAVGAAGKVAAQYPGTVTLVLDAGFPFGDGIPLLPHLSHDDGKKLDFAFYYADAAGSYLPGQTASPLGYFAFLRAGPETCAPLWLTLRWEMHWFRPLTRELSIEPERTRALVEAVLADSRVGKVFVEPPVAAALGLADDRLRFQGCRAARHDDHVHIQL